MISPFPFPPCLCCFAFPHSFSFTCLSTISSLPAWRLATSCWIFLFGCCSVMSVCVVQRHKTSRAPYGIFRESKYQTPSPVSPVTGYYNICFHVSTWFITRSFHRFLDESKQLLSCTVFNKVAFPGADEIHSVGSALQHCMLNISILYVWWALLGARFSLLPSFMRQPLHSSSLALHQHTIVTTEDATSSHQKLSGRRSEKQRSFKQLLLKGEK